jgi:protoporphyrinogen oxidase
MIKSTMAHKPPTRHWGIVGGGMLGITLAHRLASLGQRVTLLEAAPELGGLASVWSLGDITWDRHYHVTLLSDSFLRDFLREIGLEAEIRWVETRTGFYTDGKFYSMSNTAEFLRFPPLSLWQKLRLGGTIFFASKVRDWKKLEGIPVRDWLMRLSGRRTFEKIWLPLLRAKLGESYKDVSASFIWSYISRMYKARRTGLKKEMFGYVKGGYARILERCEEVLREKGVSLELNSPVQEIMPNADGRVTVNLLGKEPQVFDRVIMTCPSARIPTLCPQLSDREKKQFKDIRYLGILCASVLLKKPLGPYYVTNITDAWVPLTAVIEMTTIVDPVELNGRHLVYLPKYLMADDPAFQWSDEEIESRFLGTLEKMYPDFRRDDVEAFRISRVRNVMALPTLHFSKHLPPMKTSVPGVFAVNSGYILKGNLNVNETMELADEAFRSVLLPELEKPLLDLPATNTSATGFAEVGN